MRTGVGKRALIYGTCAADVSVMGVDVRFISYPIALSVSQSVSHDGPFIAPPPPAAAIANYSG